MHPVNRQWFSLQALLFTSTGNPSYKISNLLLTYSKLKYVETLSPLSKPEMQGSLTFGRHFSSSWLNLVYYCSWIYDPGIFLNFNKKFWCTL